MKERKYYPTNDLLFKKMLTSPNSEHILLGLIRDITGENFKKVTIKEPYSIDKYKENLEKEIQDLFITIVDIAAVLDDDTEVIVEMQISKQPYFVERSLFYTASTYITNYTKTNKYKSLKPVYSINILKFDLFNETDKSVKIYRLKDTETNEELYGLGGKPIINVCYFSLNNKNITNKNIKYWQNLFLTGEVEEKAPGYIRDAEKLVEITNLKEEERMILSQKEKIRADYESYIDYAEERGMARGIEQGIEKEKIDIVKTALLTGLKDDIIIKIAKVTKEKLEEIKKEIGKK